MVPGAPQALAPDPDEETLFPALIMIGVLK